MSQSMDFERAWQSKFSNAVGAMAGDEVCQQVMLGGELLADTTERRKIVDWSRQAMARLAGRVDENTHHSIMAQCACHYPRAQLQPIRDVYQEEGDIDIARQMLQSQFEHFLKDTLRLQQTDIDNVVSRGWGPAGRRCGNVIKVTKIPKSGNLAEYLRETRIEAKRQLYCHCPRVRDAISLGEAMPESYCYCGAGFYEAMWQEILQAPVRVELLSSVLRGDQVCTVAVHLPEEN